MLFEWYQLFLELVNLFFSINASKRKTFAFSRKKKLVRDEASGDGVVFRGSMPGHDPALDQDREGGHA